MAGIRIVRFLSSIFQLHGSGLVLILALAVVLDTASMPFANTAQGAPVNAPPESRATNTVGGEPSTDALSRPFVKPRDRFRLMAAIGDSIVQINSFWMAAVYLGVHPHGLNFVAKSGFTDTERISLASVVAGNNTPLRVDVSGKRVTIHLATNEAGVSTSSNTQVKAALDASTAFRELGVSASIYKNTDTSTFAVAGTAGVSARPLSVRANYMAMGFITYAQTILNGRFDLVRRPTVTNSSMEPGDWTFGVSGATSASIADNPGVMGDMLTAAAPIGATVLEYSGSNDVQAGNATAAQIRDRRKALWDTIEGAGLQVIACEIAPLGPSANGTTVTLAAAQARTVLVDAANAFCKSEAESRGILWVEWPVSLRASSAASNVYFTDGIHPNELGAQIMGTTLATALDPHVATTPIRIPPKGSKNWLSANPHVGATATMATFWTAPMGPSGGTSIPSRYSINSETWQRITITQLNDTTFNPCTVACVATRVTPGQHIRILGRFKVSAGFRNVSVQVHFNNDGGSIAANKTWGIDGLTSTQAAWNGTLLSPCDVVPNGVSTATLIISTYGTGTVDFRDLGIIEE